MPDLMIALVVPADDASPERARLERGDHQAILALVQDVNSDAIFLREVDGVVYVAEHGKRLESHAANPLATQVVNRFAPGFAKGDRVEGTAVFLGLDDDGQVTDVPVEVVSFVESLRGVNLA